MKMTKLQNSIQCYCLQLLKVIQFIRIMGNSVQKKVSSIKNKFGSNHKKDKILGFQFTCPNCQLKFGPKTLQEDSHIGQCLQNMQASQPILSLKLQNISPSKNQEIVYNYDLDEYLYVKEPDDDKYTKFKWKKAPILVVHPFILNMSDQQISSLSFQQKSVWFRHRLEGMRVPWMNGADFMKIDRDNVLMSSLIWSKKINMYKEVKIQFVGDKVNDAGGLLREWMHLVIKQIFDPSTGIFTLCKTEDWMYKLKWDEQIDQQFSSELLVLFGIILGKAIFEKIPINSYIDRTILRQLASPNHKIELYDIFGYDKELFQNWSFILENNIDQMGLQTYFVVNKENNDNSTVDVIELVEGGTDIAVTDQNKQMYINLSLQLICKEKVKRSMACIRKGLYQVIPEELIRVFQPYQMEMLIYGVPYIDVKDWKINTEYKGQYYAQHKVIMWFWQVMDQLSQHQLANLLKFSTGSSRTPIHGFKKLQSNRGNFSKFIIESSEFIHHNPYPKGHTCFNRLELPKYTTKQGLKLHLQAIVNTNLDGIFGLD